MTDPSTLTDPLTAAPMASVPVDLVGVTKSYGDHHALQGLDLSIAPGEFVALLGPSGCGKTTALRTIAGLEQVDGGSILIGGTDVSAVPVNRRDIGLVFQSYSLFPHLTSVQNVEFGLRMRRVPSAERRGRALNALDQVGLADHAGRYAHQLSGGQQQRVALARALVTRPRVLLLDEPLSALDAKVRVQLRDEIKRIQTELAITTVFVTHDQEEALAVADRVAVMHDGRIDQVGTPEELYLRPATPFVADFVGLSNRFLGMMAGGQLSVQQQPLPFVGEQPPDGPVMVRVRPEHLEFHADGFPVTVVSSSFLGSIRRTLITLADGTPASVQHAVRDQPQVGDQLRVRLADQPATVEA